MNQRKFEEKNWCYACGSSISIYNYFCDEECYGCFKDLFEGDSKKITRATSIITRLRKSRGLPYHHKEDVDKYDIIALTSSLDV